MAEESTKKANTFKYYSNEYDLDALKLTMREGLNDYINTLSYYKYGNRGKEVRDAFDEMWEAMLTPGRMYFDDTKGVFWDRQNKISNKADAKDAAHDPYGLAAYYIESKLKGATPWEDPVEKERKEKEANMPTLQSGYQEALYEKLFGVKNPSDQQKLDWANLDNTERYSSLINALKNIDITLFKDYLEKYTDLDAYYAAIEGLGKYLTDEKNEIGFLDNEYYRFNLFNPYVDWHVFSIPTSAELKEQLLQQQTATATSDTTTQLTNPAKQEFLQQYPINSNYAFLRTLNSTNTFNDNTYSQNTFKEAFSNFIQGKPIYVNGSLLTSAQSLCLILNYLNYIFSNSNERDSLFTKDSEGNYWYKISILPGYGLTYDPSSYTLQSKHVAHIPGYVQSWLNLYNNNQNTLSVIDKIFDEIPSLRHGGRMIPKAQPGADTNTWLQDSSLWISENDIMNWLVEQYATNPNFYNLTNIYGVRDGQWSNAFDSAGSSANAGTYKTATNANGTTANDREKDNRYKALTDALFTDTNHTKLSNIGLLFALMVDAINPQDEALFFEYEKDDNGKIKRSNDGKRIVVKDDSGNPKLREGEITIKDNDLNSHTYANVADMMYNLRTDNKLSVVHNSFGTDVSRYYITKDDGTTMYLNNITTMPKNYEMLRLGKTRFDPGTGLYITDYELIPKTEQAEKKAEKEVKKEEKKGPESGTKPEGDTGKGDNLKKKKLFDIEPWAIGIFGQLPGLFSSIHANNRVAKILNEHLRPTVWNPYELLRPVVGDFATRMHYNNQAAGLRYFSLMATTSDATLNYLLAMHGNKAANDLETLGYLADNKEIRRTTDEAMKLQLQNTENRNRVANTNLLNINLTWEKRGEIESERIKGNADSLNDFFNKSRDFAWNMYTYKRGKKDEKEKAILAYGALSIVNKYDDMRALLHAAMKEALPGTTSLEWTNYPEFVEANRKISQAMNKELSQYALKDPNDIDVKPFTELNITNIINNLKSAVKPATTSSTTTSGQKHGGRLVKKHFNI